MLYSIYPAHDACAWRIINSLWHKQLKFQNSYQITSSSLKFKLLSCLHPLELCIKPLKGFNMIPTPTPPPFPIPHYISHVPCGSDNQSPRSNHNQHTLVFVMGGEMEDPTPILGGRILTESSSDKNGKSNQGKAMLKELGANHEARTISL